MTQTKFIFLLVVLICTKATYVIAHAEVNPDEKTVMYLNEFRAAYIKGILDKEPERIASYYAENIRLMPEFQKTIMGKSHALTYHKAFSARFTIQEYTRDKIEMLDLGSRVVELGVFTMKMTLKSTGQKHELKGNYQNFWDKSELGRLALITEAWNYSHQVKIAEQLKFEGVPAVQTSYQAHLPVNSPISFELAALNRLMELTIMQHDAKIWSQFYTDDTKLVYSNHPIYEGKKAVDGFLENHVRQLPVFEKLDIRNDQIDNLKDYVIEYASHIAIIRGDDWSGVNTGKNVTIWRRGTDGSLKIYRGMAMYD